MRTLQPKYECVVLNSKIDLNAKISLFYLIAAENKEGRKLHQILFFVCFVFKFSVTLNFSLSVSFLRQTRSSKQQIYYGFTSPTNVICVICVNNSSIQLLISVFSLILNLI